MELKYQPQLVSQPDFFLAINSTVRLMFEQCILESKTFPKNSQIDKCSSLTTYHYLYTIPTPTKMTAQ